MESVSFRPQQRACLQCSSTDFKHFLKSGDIMMLLENYASFQSHEAWNYLAPTGMFCAKQAALLKTHFKSKWLDIICSNDTCFLAHRHHEEQLDAQELLVFRSGWQLQHEKRAKGQRLSQILWLLFFHCINEFTSVKLALAYSKKTLFIPGQWKKWSHWFLAVLMVILMSFWQ